MVKVTVRNQVARGKKASQAYYKSRRRGGMKRTTRKGAYKKTNKKFMMRRRAPFVETKSKTHEDLVVQFPGLVDRSDFRTTAAQAIHMPPHTFLMWKRGLEENEVIGNSCYAKYLKMKVGVRFPQSAFLLNGSNKQIPLFPQNYELIWGWVTTPLNYTNQTNPKADEANINPLINVCV